MINFALVDLEATCNNDRSFPREEMEIIEIGAVMGVCTPERYEITSTFQLYVRPVINPQLTEFCTKLTGITQEMVDAASPLDKAIADFWQWLYLTDVQVWGSWGAFDKQQFIMECVDKDIECVIADYPHVNAKKIFQGVFGGRVGLGRAVDRCGLTFQGKQHSGLDDATNIAHLFTHEAKLRERFLERSYG